MSIKTYDMENKMQNNRYSYQQLLDIEKQQYIEILERENFALKNKLEKPEAKKRNKRSNDNNEEVDEINFTIFHIILIIAIAFIIALFIGSI